MQVRKRDNGHVSIGECSYPDVDDPLSSPAQSPSINSIPPAAMAAAAAAASLDGVSSSLDSDDSIKFAGSSSSTGLGPPTFGSSFISDDDPYAWAQKLRRIPDKVKLMIAGSYWSLLKPFILVRGMWRLSSSLLASSSPDGGNASPGSLACLKFIAWCALLLEQ